MISFITNPALLITVEANQQPTLQVAIMVSEGVLLVSLKGFAAS